MRKFSILDCTLRDGGYVNDWKFGSDNINYIKSGIEKMDVDIIELGFLRDVKFDINTTIYSNTMDLSSVIGKKAIGKKYAAFIEIGENYPIDKLGERTEETVDIIRFSMWKRNIDETIKYAECIKNLGYELFIQPTRAEQYSEEEFKDLVIRFSKINPSAIYIVDTFGLLQKEDVEKYALVAHKYMPKDMMLGYHAHNNMQQAIGNAMHLVELGLDRKIIIDASVAGMGRGAGNLPLEILLKYSSTKFNTTLNIDSCFSIYDKCLRAIYDEKKWGYDMRYYLTALYGGNPNYAKYLIEKNVSVSTTKEIFDIISKENLIRYSHGTLDLIDKLIDKDSNIY